MNESTVPAGWYPDAQDPNTERFWDGTTWTSHTRPVGGGSVSANTQYAVATPAGPAKPGNKMVAYIILAIAVVAAIAVAIFIFLNNSGNDNGGSENPDQAKDRYLGWLAKDYPEVAVTEEHAMIFAVDYCRLVGESTGTPDWQSKTGPYVEQVMADYPQYNFTTDLAVVMDMAIFAYCTEHFDHYVDLAEGAYTASQWNMFKDRYSKMP